MQDTSGSKLNMNWVLAKIKLNVLEIDLGLYTGSIIGGLYSSRTLYIYTFPLSVWLCMSVRLFPIKFKILDKFFNEFFPFSCPPPLPSELFGLNFQIVSIPA